MKTVYFIGTARDDIRSFPKDVRQEVGFSIETAQLGNRALNAVPLVGFGGAGVLEIIANNDGDTYRAVYTVKLGDSIYVLHAFMKKSKRGARTPKKDMDMIRRRLKAAEDHYASEQKQEIVERKNAGTKG